MSNETRHPDRPDERVELVPVDLDSALEWSEVVPRISVRRCTPAHGIEEGVEASRVVELGGAWKCRALERASARLDLPDDLDRLVHLGIVINAPQCQQMLALCCGLKDI